MEDLEKLGENLPYRENKDSLLRKYDIPISFLDFEYVKNCSNGRELEKILHILISGEEGYYPQLIEKTKERLREIKPNSKYIREVTPVLNFKYLDETTKNALGDDLKQWLDFMHRNDEELIEHKKAQVELQPIPNVRKAKEQIETSTTKPERIKSTDYKSWDKYDPDTELLKIDLEAEEQKRLQEKKKQEEAKIEKPIKTAEFLTSAEATFEAEREREKGNEYFKEGDYKLSVIHYTNSLNFQTSVHSYNNRAIAYIKLRKYEKAIRDCKAVLKIDSANAKANLRLAQSYQHLENYELALKHAENVIKVDPNNTIAQNLLNKLHTQLETVKKTTITKKSTRIKITEVENELKTPVKNLEKSSPKAMKSILKNNDKNKVLLPIPGPSTMPEPYFITVENEDPQVIKKHELLIKNRPQLIHIGSIDNDDSDCMEIHLKTSKTDDQNFLKTNLNINECSSNSSTNFNGQTDSDVEWEEITENQLQILNNNLYDNSGGSGEPHKDLNENEVPLNLQDLHMPFTFYRLWRSLAKDYTYSKHAEMLRNMEIDRFTNIIGYKLDSKMLSDIIRTLYLHFTVAHETERVNVILRTVASLPRFNIVAMFITPEDKEKFQCLVDFLVQHGNPLSEATISMYFS